MLPITIKHRYFYQGCKRFLVNGVVYQQHNGRSSPRPAIADPLADDQLEDLRRSIPIFRELGLNTIFVFSIDETKSHDAAMELLAEAGIYVLAHTLNRSRPFESYTPDLLGHHFRVVDVMSRYANTLGILAASEMIYDSSSTRAAPAIRAVVRDVKRYMSLNAATSQTGSPKATTTTTAPRILPVGYSASDVRAVLMPTFHYLSAGDGEEAVDFFCYCNYAWCGHASMRISGYDREAENFSPSQIPVFFSEYGGNTVSPRPFEETRAIYSPEMTGVFSGGVVYEFFEGASRYGLVKKKKTGEKQRQQIEKIPPPSDSNIPLDAAGQLVGRQNDVNELGGGTTERGAGFEKSQDFENLKTSLQRSFMTVDAGAREELDTLASSHGAGIEAVSRKPGMPEKSHSWLVDGPVPDSPLDWDEVRAEIEDSQWVDVEKEMRELRMRDDAT